MGAASVGAPTLVGWGESVYARCSALGDVPQACASCPISWRVSRRRLGTYGWSWGAERLPGSTPWEWSASSSIASHAACGIHPPAGWRRRFFADPLRGRWTRPSREAPPGATFAAPPAPPPLPLGPAVALGGGVDVGGCNGVVGTAYGGGPGGFFVVLYRGGA